MQLFSAGEGQATPAKSTASQKTPQWVSLDSPSPRDATAYMNADLNEDEPSGPLQTNPDHKVLLN